MGHRILPDDVLVECEFAFLVGGLPALNIPGFLQLHHSGPDGILFPLDTSLSTMGIRSALLFPELRMALEKVLCLAENEQ